MSNIYDMSGKKKIIFAEELEADITYKEIMKIVIEHSTEEGCKNIFTYGGVSLCPSEIFGQEKIDIQKEEDDCNYNGIRCTKCWMNAIRLLK